MFSPQRQDAIGLLPRPQLDIDGFVGNGVSGVKGISGYPRGSDYRGQHSSELSEAVRPDLLCVNQKQLTLSIRLSCKSTSEYNLICTVFSHKLSFKVNQINIVCYDAHIWIKTTLENF